MEIVTNGDKHIDTKLMFRLKMFIAILALLTGVLIYEMCTSNIPFMWALFGVSAGFLVGVVIGRMFAI